MVKHMTLVLHLGYISEDKEGYHASTAPQLAESTSLQRFT